MKTVIYIVICWNNNYKTVIYEFPTLKDIGNILVEKVSFNLCIHIHSVLLDKIFDSLMPIMIFLFVSR